MEIGIEHYIILSMCLFALGLFIILTKKNAILILMGLELLFNAANINLVASSKFHANINGQMFALFVMVIAACELAIALALLYKLYHYFGSNNPDAFQSLGERDD